MSTEHKAEKPKSIETKVKWQKGMPEQSLAKTKDGSQRKFLLKGEWAIAVGYLYEDGSGFDTGEWADSVTAWAIVDGF
jgi:hypothetical protein